jgi:hypothetical protein
MKNKKGHVIVTSHDPSMLSTLRNVHERTSLTYNAEFLFQIECSHEAHSCSTQRRRAFNLEQKGKLESGRYFMHVP